MLEGGRLLSKREGRALRKYSFWSGRLRKPVSRDCGGCDGGCGGCGGGCGGCGGGCTSVCGGCVGCVP